MYSLIEWKGENLVNVYALSRILSPRKELCDYKVRDVVKAKFGNGVYEATILELSENPPEKHNSHLTSLKPRPKAKAKPDSSKRASVNGVHSDSTREDTQIAGSCQGGVHVVGKEIIQNHCHTTNEPVVSIIYNGSSSKASEVHKQDENDMSNINSNVITDRIPSPKSFSKPRKRSLEFEDWSFTQEMYRDLQKQIKRLKRMVERQADKIEKLEKNDVDMSTDNQEDEVVPGRSLSFLRTKIEHVTSMYECVKILATDVFPEQVLCDSSISGKRSFKSSEAGARPPLPQAVLAAIEKIVREKDNSITHKWFVGKLQSVQKVLRRKKTEALILLDLIGAKNARFYSSFPSTHHLFERLQRIEAKLKKGGYIQTDKTYFNGGLLEQPLGIEDDHVAFMERGVPILHVIPVPFPDCWHKSCDDRKSIDKATVHDLLKIFHVFIKEIMRA